MASSQRSHKVPDAEAIEDDERQYGHGPVSKEELDLKYPNRPHNHSKTLPFHKLFTDLFNPLADQKKPKGGPAISRKKVGLHGPGNPSPQEERRNIVTRFVSNWRKEVGDDFYPAIRLMLPDKDRDRAMYGLKEISIAKLIVKLLNLHKDSDDGFNLLNWKLPARGPTKAASTGDFASRCYDVLAKRPMRQKVGDMRIAEVNEMLDQLSGAQKEEQQLPIFRKFYQRMNAEELMWLIRMILRQMKIGATEKTLLTLWHKDGEALFNVSSSLRRVCWELWDPTKSLDDDETGVELMSCFQPQLAQFMPASFEKIVSSMGAEGDDDEFWIEEKLDGERMQMHMMEDDDVPGGFRFGWWSRKGKEYTYLYGNGLEDNDSAMSRHLNGAFNEKVHNIILDGEMITWDPTTDKMVPFGTLKTAAIAGKKDPFSDTDNRPLFRIFDCLYMNGQNLTKYTLRVRRNVLLSSIHNVKNRFEIHDYQPGRSAEDLTPALKKIVEESSEGLVVKNPRSMYRLNSRNDDWMKVKPEYMTGFGESLDCIIIGGYYGSGHRGGNLSSFLCGLRVDKKKDEPDANPMKCYSFFKVGGGFNADDYAAIRHQTEGKWHKWDPKNPPIEYMELAGANQEKERPDVWIKACDSIVIEAKAASVGPSDSFRTKYTLRFPRFKRLRPDKDWTQALSTEEFLDLKAKVESDTKSSEFKVDKKKRLTKRLKKEKVIAGNDLKTSMAYSGPKTQIFHGLNFCVLSEMLTPFKKSKAELEQTIKSNGGSIFQSPTAAPDMLVIGEKRVVKIASLIKAKKTNIIKPIWIFDALKQMERDGVLGRDRFLVPWEGKHIFWVREEDKMGVEEATDEWGDSYARDTEGEELRGVVEGMEEVKLEEGGGFDKEGSLGEWESKGIELGLRGNMFRECVAWLVVGGDEDGDGEQHMQVDMQIAKNWFEFADGVVRDDLFNPNDKRKEKGKEKETGKDITHVIFADGVQEDRVQEVRRILGMDGAGGDEDGDKDRIPHMVGWRWIRDSWDEGKKLDEGGYKDF